MVAYCTKSVIMTSQIMTQNLIATRFTMCESVCVSLSLVVEESDATVVTASDEGWGSGRVGETTDGGQVTCTQRNKRSSEHVQETNLPTF